MTPARASLLLMAKIALSDGVLVEKEREFLIPLLAQDETIESLLEEAQRNSYKELAAPVESYPDRFIVALRTATMAAVDRSFHEQEIHDLKELMDLLDISHSDWQVIQQSLDTMHIHQSVITDPRVEELYKKSSFADQ